MAKRMGIMHDELILDHTLLRVLEHFRIAKVDYARNVTKYTEIQREEVANCIRELEKYGFLEKYTNTSIKRSAAKLKKSAEVHKHHTYFKITRNGVLALNKITPSAYLHYLAGDCLSLLEGDKQPSKEDRIERIVRMGLLDKTLHTTELGQLVLKEWKKK